MRGSQRLGMSNVVAVSCNPYEDRKSLWADKVTPKNTKGEPPDGRLAFLRIVSCAERIRVGDRLIIPKQQAPTQKTGDSRLFGVKIS